MPFTKTIFLENDLSSDHRIEELLSNPLNVGFLLKFGEYEHNCENIRFLLAVDGFRDMIIAHDSVTWTRSWRELDETYITPYQEVLLSITSSLPPVSRENTNINNPAHISILQSDLDSSETVVSSFVNDVRSQYKWSSRVNKIDFDRAVRYIWNEYIADSSTSQICLPSIIAKRMKIRYELRHIYGPSLFHELCIDPLKTIKRDILPRYIGSVICSSLEINCNSPYNLMDDLLNILPKDNLQWFDNRLKHSRKVSFDRNGSIAKEFELYEILDCGILFQEFLSYLQKSRNCENLLCVRMIEIFEDYITQSSKTIEAEQQAWKIYKSFIAPMSPFEISLNYLDRKDIMLRMSSPNLVIFESAKKSAYNALRCNYEQYKQTTSYQRLGHVLYERLYMSTDPREPERPSHKSKPETKEVPTSDSSKNEQLTTSGKSNFLSCFGKG